MASFEGILHEGVASFDIFSHELLETAFDFSLDCLDLAQRYLLCFGRRQFLVMGLRVDQRDLRLERLQVVRRVLQHACRADLFVSNAH